ncbi:hypothetical protein [Rhizobium sp.]|uniref:hypothetical protein n=1 Tax=Rhizobium sp. TaxID=391 RepID=UPI0028B1AB2F
MKRTDFSEYEKRRAQDHEEAWRLSATLENIHSRHCHYRMCRRSQFCSGPMLPSEHQRSVISAQKEIGLSGMACARLPMCMANATLDRYAYVRGALEKITEARNGELKHLTFWGIVFLIQMQARSQHRNAPRT